MLAKLSLIILLSWQNFCVSYSSQDAIHFPPPLVEVPGSPIGHLKPYGSQSAPQGPVKEYNEPLTAEEFWQKHVKPHVPLVYRQAISKSPALKSWTDEYLSEKYGDLDVLVELKKENRTKSSGRMRLQDFLKLYMNEELYVVSMLPSEMMVDIQVRVVPCLTKRIQVSCGWLQVEREWGDSMLSLIKDRILGMAFSFALQNEIRRRLLS